MIAGVSDTFLTVLGVLWRQDGREPGSAASLSRLDQGSATSQQQGPLG